MGSKNETGTFTQDELHTVRDALKSRVETLTLQADDAHRAGQILLAGELMKMADAARLLASRIETAAR